MFGKWEISTSLRNLPTSSLVPHSEPGSKSLLVQKPSQTEVTGELQVAHPYCAGSGRHNRAREEKDSNFSNLRQIPWQAHNFRLGRRPPHMPMKQENR